MFCKYCGTKLIDDAAFCHECGKTTAEQPVQPAHQPPVSPAPAVQPVYQPPVTPVPPVQIVYQRPEPVCQQPVYQQPIYQQPTPPVQPAPPQYTYTIPGQPAQAAPAPTEDALQLAQLEQQTLTFGILGLCLSMLGVPGIIFSSIAGKKAHTYKQLTGNLTGKAAVGYRLAKAGKIVSIIMTVILTLIVLTAQGEIDFEYNDPFEYYDF